MINCYNHILQDSLTHLTPNHTHKILTKNPSISPRSPPNISHGSLTRSTDIPLDPSSDIPIGSPRISLTLSDVTWCSFFSTLNKPNYKVIFILVTGSLRLTRKSISYSYKNTCST